MQYPLYDYYKRSNLNLLGIIAHYAKCIYQKHYGRDKTDKVLKKALAIKGMKPIYEYSLQNRRMPSVQFIGEWVNGNLWFLVQSNKTQALAVLFIMQQWQHDVNEEYFFEHFDDVRDEAIKVFKMYSIYEEMSEEEFNRGAR